MAPNTTSALGMALNNKSAFVDIPKPREGGLNAGRDNFTAVSTAASNRSGGILPTPPNSISPNLPPQQRDIARTSPVSAQQESDLDLHDAPHNPLTAEALDSLGDLNSAGAITPGMLAKHHLPDILLNHGPLAIRHIMSYLNSTVPGFSRITSAKARRLVVAALEGRGAGAELAGVDGDVVFEKVGWGRWDARRKGQPSRDGGQHTFTPPGSLPSSYGGIQMAGGRDQRLDRLGTSFTATSGPYSDEDHDMLEHEADKMSLDDEAGYQSSEAPPPDPLDDMDDGEATDEEDWQSIGAEALRARSLPPGSLPKGRMPSVGSRIYQPVSYIERPRLQRPPPNLAQSVPNKSIPVNNSSHFNNFPAAVNDSQERAAIEALLSLGSM